MSQAIEPQSGQVPELARTPALDLTPEDIALPRIYTGQFMSKAVQQQLVKFGEIYSANNSEDPDPQILWRPGDSEGVLFHVLTLRKGKSIQDGGELVMFDFDDPAAPEDAWVTYNYMLFLPEHDEDVPYKITLTRTGRPAAQQINVVLAKNAGSPHTDLAFRLSAAVRENAKGKFAVLKVQHVEAEKANAERAGELARQMSAAPVEHSRGEQPAI